MAIALFTDFGAEGIYTGQMESVIDAIAPQVRILSLLNNAPVSNPFLSAYLLAALAPQFPEQTVFLCVVDPGVGGDRQALVLQTERYFFVGPDNGLLNVVAKHAEICQWYDIIWRPEKCSQSFHGRDIFAPVAAKLAIGQCEDYLKKRSPLNLDDWETDLAQIIYCDHYGNLMTGIRYHAGLNGLDLVVKQQRIRQAGTFCQVQEGELFWYANSLGLVEIAANRRSAQVLLGVQLADPVHFVNE